MSSPARSLAQTVWTTVYAADPSYSSEAAQALARLQQLAIEGERSSAALGWVRDFAESQSPYHAGFKHIVRYIDSASNDFEQGGTGAILDGSVAGAAEEDDNR